MMHNITRTTIIFIDKLIFIKGCYMKFDHQKTSTLLHCKPVKISTNDLISKIAKFMGPTWGPPGSWRPQMGPMLGPWTLLSGIASDGVSHHRPPYWLPCLSWYLLNNFGLVGLQQNISTWAKLFILNNFQYKHPQQESCALYIVLYPFVRIAYMN